MRVVLADDDVLLREGLASLLERPGFEVVGRAGDGLFARLVRALVPDLAVSTSGCRRTTDGGSGRGQGISDELPDIALLVLSATSTWSTR